MNSAKILIAKVDGYQLGIQHGKTMAEVDAYYKGLLKEIEELTQLLELRDSGIKELEEEHATDRS